MDSLKSLFNAEEAWYVSPLIIELGDVNTITLGGDNSVDADV